jgi:hypothetical protein
MASALANSDQANELLRTVSDFYYAIGENRLEAAMSFYHRDSPFRDEIRRELQYGQSAYLQRTKTLSSTVVQHDNNRAILVAIHQHLRIAGIKYLQSMTQNRYELRRQGATWKIWSIIEKPP